MTIPVIFVAFNIGLVYGLWSTRCWVMASTSSSPSLKLILLRLMVVLLGATIIFCLPPLPRPLSRPRPLSTLLGVEWFSEKAFNACSSLSCCVIFYSWTSRKFCNSSIERVSISLDSSIEQITKINFAVIERMIFSTILRSSSLSPWIHILSSLRNTLKLALPASFEEPRTLVKELGAAHVSPFKI